MGRATRTRVPSASTRVAKLPDWAALEERGISVKRDVLPEEAAGVVRHYSESGVDIYNARQGD